MSSARPAPTLRGEGVLGSRVVNPLGGRPLCVLKSSILLGLEEASAQSYSASPGRKDGKIGCDKGLPTVYPYGNGHVRKGVVLRPSIRSLMFVRRVVTPF